MEISKQVNNATLQRSYVCRAPLIQSRLQNALDTPTALSEDAHTAADYEAANQLTALSASAFKRGATTVRGGSPSRKKKQKRSAHRPKVSRFRPNAHNWAAVQVAYDASMTERTYIPPTCSAIWEIVVERGRDQPNFRHSLQSLVRHNEQLVTYIKNQTVDIKRQTDSRSNHKSRTVLAEEIRERWLGVNAAPKPVLTQLHIKYLLGRL